MKKNRQRKKFGMCSDDKQKTTKTSKTTTIRNKPEVTCERRKTKKLSRQDKRIQTKEDIPLQRKKSITKKGLNAATHAKNLMTRKQNNFEAKYWDKENMTQKLIE